MECKVKTNHERCNCTYEPCSRKGVCCDCVAYHRRQNELPACYFTTKAEKTYDRSIDAFINMQKSIDN